MDFKKLSRFIMLVGALICIGGGVYYFINHPVGYQQVPLSRQNLFGDFGRNIQAKWAAHDENIRRKGRREIATGIAIVGGFIFVMGFGINFSARSDSR